MVAMIDAGGGISGSVGRSSSDGPSGNGQRAVFDTSVSNARNDNRRSTTPDKGSSSAATSISNPRQADLAASTNLEPSDDNVVAAGAQSVEVGGTTYQLGPTPPPSLHHDNGFLQNPDDPSDPVPLPTREPTQEEIDYYNSERRQAELGNIASAIPGAGFFDSRADLDNGIDHYRHFLNGGGEPYSFDYGEYFEEDLHGQTTRDSVLEDVRFAGDQIYEGLVDSGDLEPGESVTFNVTSDAIAVNDNVAINPDARFPYPQTENWQKAIGAHHVWSDSEVTVTRLEDGRLLATAEVTIHAEDRYNFNPGQADIATKVPDSERGVLEESGLAHQFDQSGTAEFTTQWIIGEPGTPNPLATEGASR